jgi:hypothetical protein
MTAKARLVYGYILLRVLAKGMVSRTWAADGVKAPLRLYSVPYVTNGMMSSMDRRVALYFAVLSLSALSLQGQTPSNGQSDHPLVSSMTTEAFQQRVKALGFVTEQGSANGNQGTFFTFMAEGRKIGGLALSPEAVELFISFSDGAALETVNEWNRTHYSSSAFVDQKGNACVKSILVVEGGVTQENLNAFITRFRESAIAYARFIVDHNKK